MFDKLVQYFVFRWMCANEEREKFFLSFLERREKARFTEKVVRIAKKLISEKGYSREEAIKQAEMEAYF